MLLFLFRYNTCIGTLEQEPLRLALCLVILGRICYNERTNLYIIMDTSARIAMTLICELDDHANINAESN